MKINMKNNILANNGIILGMCLFLGIVLLLWPTEALSTGSMILATIMLIGAIGSVGFYLLNKKEKTRTDALYLIISVLIIAISISIFANPTWIIATINIFVGLILVVNSIGEIISVLSIRVNDKIWWAFIIVPTIALIVGLIIIFNPVKVASFITRLEGIALIINTLSTMLIMHRTKNLLITIK